MLDETIKLLSAAFYDSDTVRLSLPNIDDDFDDAIRFLNTISANVTKEEDGTITVEPVVELPKSGDVFTIRGCSKSSAILFSAIAANIGCTFRFPDIRDGNITKKEADEMSKYVRGVLQFAIASNGFIAASANVYETSGCIAHSSVVFTAGLILSLPFCAGEPCFSFGEDEPIPLFETTCRCLSYYNLVTKRCRDILYVKSIRGKALTERTNSLGELMDFPEEE